jgi:hypothetical protein
VRGVRNPSGICFDRRSYLVQHLGHPQTNANTLTAIRLTVTTGNRTGVLDAARRGITSAAPSPRALSWLP